MEIEELRAQYEAGIFTNNQWLAPLEDASMPEACKEMRDQAWGDNPALGSEGVRYF